MNDGGEDVNSIGEIKMNFGGVPYVGSGCMQFSLDFLGRELRYVITCAHNFIEKKDDGSWREATDIIFNRKKDKGESYESYKVVKFFCHPKYNGSCVCGYDYAVGILDQDSVTQKNHDYEHYSSVTIHNTIRLFFDAEKAKKLIGCKVMVNGYPGEEGGKAYKAKGVIKEICVTP